MENKEPYHTIIEKRNDLQGQRSRSQGYVVRLTVVGPKVEFDKSQKYW